MADAIVSAVAERIIAIVEKQIRYQVNLVRGVEEKVLNLSHELKTIIKVVDDTEKRGFKEESVRDWLKRLEDTSYEMEDVLDEWNIAILKLEMERESTSSAVAAPPKQKVYPSILSSCLCFKKVVVRRDIAKKIENLKEQLDLILAEKDRYHVVMSQPTTTDPSPKSWRVQSTSSIDLAEVHGRECDKETLVSKLRPEDGSQEELSLQVLAIVGVGGVGKPTLAQLVYNDSRVKDRFEKRIWICVSDPFDVAGMAKGIIESVGEKTCPNTDQLEMVLQCLRDSFSGKRFRLVLVDVWTEDYTKWEPLKNSLKCGGSGSKILVTTRNERVAKMMGTIVNDIYYTRHLSDEDCWLVLNHMALVGRNEEGFKNFQDIGKKIAKKCKGLPLASKVLGSLLRFKNSLEEWENVLNSELWQLEEAEEDLFPHLMLSYNELSPILKRCFSYCAILTKDSEIEVEKLIGNWMALGYSGTNVGTAGDMELKGKEYFQNLAMRSLFQDFKENDLDGQIISCKMHDVVHDFAQYLRNIDKSNGRVEAAMKKATNCQSCSPLLVSHVKEYRSLFYEKEPPPHICDCLTSLRALGLTRYKLLSIPRGMENLIHFRWLDLSDNDLSRADLKTIFDLYNLQTLYLHFCRLQEIPREIENLIHWRHLDLSHNRSLKELPDSICGLLELRTLNLEWCDTISRIPEGIHRLVNLKHLHNRNASHLNQFPQGLAELTNLHTLSEFCGGRGWSNLRWLKNLNHLAGSLTLNIKLTDDLEGIVEGACEAELRKKMHIQELEIIFLDEMDEKNHESVRMDVMDALKPHPNLENLKILFYKGSKFPGWFTSPVNQVRHINLTYFERLSSLPPLGKLPCLEELEICDMCELQFVGKEFLGITSTRTRDMEDIKSSSSSSSSAAAINYTFGFPKLKVLKFSNCPNWTEWEDITKDEYVFASVSILPCLLKLTIKRCSLTELPDRLLYEARSLKWIEFPDSKQLRESFDRLNRGSTGRLALLIP